MLPTLETRRLILRPPAAEDFEAFAAFAADEQAALFLGGPQPRPVAWRTWSMFAGSWLLNGYSMFSFIEKGSGRWIGRGGPWQPDGWPGTEVGWGIIPEAQRQGYAKEAAAAAIDWAFEHLGWSEVIHCIAPENTASIATARSVGSTLLREGMKAPPPFNAVWDIYGQARATWEAARAPR